MTPTAPWCWRARPGCGPPDQPLAGAARRAPSRAPGDTPGPVTGRPPAADTLSRVPGAPHTNTRRARDAPPEPSRGAARGRVPIVPAGPRALRRACAAAAVALIPVLAGCEAGSNAPSCTGTRPRTGRPRRSRRARARSRYATRSSSAPRRTPPCRPAVPPACSWDWSTRGRGTAWSASPRRAPPPRSPLPQGGVLLEQNSSALLTGPQPEVILSGLTRSLPGGTYIRVLLTFQRAGTVVMTVPVIARANSFATFSPAPTASPTPSVSATGKRHHGQASATPTPSVSGSATATPTATPTS